MYSPIPNVANPQQFYITPSAISFNHFSRNRANSFQKLFLSHTFTGKTYILNSQASKYIPRQLNSHLAINNLVNPKINSAPEVFQVTPSRASAFQHSAVQLLFQKEYISIEVQPQQLLLIQLTQRKLHNAAPLFHSPAGILTLPVLYTIYIHIPTRARLSASSLFHLHSSEGKAPLSR